MTIQAFSHSGLGGRDYVPDDTASSQTLVRETKHLPGPGPSASLDYCPGLRNDGMEMPVFRQLP